MNRLVTSPAYVTNLQITQLPGNMAPSLTKLEGYYEGGTQAWLQFFDSLGVPANTTVPLYEESLGLAAPNGYSWQFNNPLLINLNGALQSVNLTAGLIVCVSTTQGALTIGTGTNKSSFYISLEEWETQPNEVVTKTGNTSSGVASITPWADGTFHTIDKIIVSTSQAVITYLQLYTQASYTAGLIAPLEQWALAINQPLTELNFRGVGFIPSTQDATVAPPVIHNGCYLAVSTTSGFYTASISAPNAQTLQCNWF